MNVPTTVMQAQQATVLQPVERTAIKHRIVTRPTTQTRLREVRETVQVPVQRACGCYRARCGCAGRVGCGCCYPACGCAPRVQLATQVRVRHVPEQYTTQETVRIPYTVKTLEHVKKTVTR